MRGNTRIVHSDTSLNGMLNPLRDHKVVVNVIIAGREGWGKNDAFDSRRETRRQELRRCHVKVPADAPGASAHFKLMLDMVKDNPVDRASALLTMLQINRKAYEPTIKDSADLGDADAMGEPVIHQLVGEGDLVPPTSTKDAASARRTVGKGAHGRRKGSGPPKLIGTPDLSGG